MQYCTPTKHINPPNTNIKKQSTERHIFSSFRKNNPMKKFPNKIVPKLPVKISFQNFFSFFLKIEKTHKIYLELYTQSQKFLLIHELLSDYNQKLELEIIQKNKNLILLKIKDLKS